jgi:hypothetical protein
MFSHIDYTESMVEHENNSPNYTGIWSGFFLTSLIGAMVINLIYNYRCTLIDIKWLQ